MSHIVCVHGLGGTAATMGPLAAALAAAGHDAVAITLPAHGTTPDHLVGITWREWLDAVPAADVLVGQSMGGALALAAAAERPDVHAVVCINAPAPDPDAVDGLEWRRSRGHEWVDAPAAAPGEVAYDRLPIGSLLTMAEGMLLTDLSAVTQPVLLITSADDEVVDPASSDVIAANLVGPVERCTLEHGGHTASLGPQLDALVDAVLAFVSRAASQPHRRS